MMTDQYDDIELHESLDNDAVEVIQGHNVRVFTGETAYTDAKRFFSDLVLNKVYNTRRRVW